MNDQLSEKSIGACFKVYNTLGFGFLESVYEKALGVELATQGLQCATQVPIQVFYEGHNVGDFLADVVVEGQLILELKSVSQLLPVHEVQLVNYLKATNRESGLLINFGPDKVEVRRKFKNPKR